MYLNNQPLTEVTIPADVTRIGAHLFDGCKSIRTVKLSGTVTEIRDYAFNGCENITDISLPDGLRYIDMAAFAGCGFTKIEIPRSVTMIQKYAFPDLDEVYIQDLTAWCYLSFNYGANPLEDGADLYLNNQLATEIEIPQNITEINNNAFSGCTSIHTLKIHDNVKTIGTKAFSNCKNLETVQMGAGVESISGGAFSECVSLRAIDLPDTLTDIGNTAFYHCTSLQTVDIPANVTQIGSQVFRECSALTSINVSASNGTFASDSGVLYNKNKTEVLFCPPGKTGSYAIVDGVVTVRDNAFYYNCLSGISIPDTVETIEQWAFGYGMNLTEIDIPDSVTSIGDSAFNHCLNLASVSLHYGLEKIGYDTFNYCASLNRIEIPDSVVSMGSRVFDYCGNMTHAVLGSGITSIGYATFEYCSALESVEIKGDVNSIEQYAFRGCSALADFVIPSGVTKIEDSTFGDCTSLTGITIHENITSIGSYAFSRCTGIEEIRIPQSVTSISDSAFNECSALTCIDVDVHNSAYCSPDGVLYTADKTKLVICPGGKTGTLTIPATVEKIGSIGSKLSYIEVEPGNRFYTSQDGVLYNSEVTELIAYPGERADAYVVPATVTNISNLASDRLTELTFSDIDKIRSSLSGRTFSKCSALTDINAAGSSEKYYTEGGVLFNKDKTVLIAFPAGREGEYTIPDGVDAVQGWAFSSAKIARVNIPSGIRTLQAYSFAGCGLQSVDMPDSITTVAEHAFSNCENLRDVKISGRLREIGLGVFSNTGLETVELPSSVTRIQDSAFSHCENLKSIILPSSVTYIAPWAFSQDVAFTDIYFVGTREQWNRIEITNDYNEFFISAQKHFNYNMPVSEITVRNEGITVSTKLDNLTDPEYPQKSEVFVVLYDEADAVIDLYKAVYDGGTVTGEFGNNPKADHIKVFVWDKDGSLSPIAGAAEYIDLGEN